MALKECPGHGGIARRNLFSIFDWTPPSFGVILCAVTFTVQGRALSSADLKQIRQCIAEHPQWSRRRLSQALCEEWNWRNGAGQLKDMASRSLLLKLEQRGHIQLPVRRQAPSNRMRQTPVVPWRWESSPCVGALGQVGPLQVSEVSQDRAGRQEVSAALGGFHYLGFGGTVGDYAQMRIMQS